MVCDSISTDCVLKVGKPTKASIVVWTKRESFGVENGSSMSALTFAVTP